MRRRALKSPAGPAPTTIALLGLWCTSCNCRGINCGDLNGSLIYTLAVMFTQICLLLASIDLFKRVKPVMSVVGMAHACAKIAVNALLSAACDGVTFIESFFCMSGS